MENQEKKKNAKPVVIAVIITLLFLAIIAYLGGQSIMQSAYNDGYNKGVSDTKAGSKEEMYKNNASLLESRISQYESYLLFLLDNAVFVTEHGEKYHRFECQYMRNSRCWIYNVEAAQGKGFDACSVCFGKDASDYLADNL